MKLNLKTELSPKKLSLTLDGETADLLDKYVAMVHEQEQISVDERVIAAKILDYALANDRDFRKWRLSKAKAAKKAENNVVTQAQPESSSAHNGY